MRGIPVSKKTEFTTKTNGESKKSKNIRLMGKIYAFGFDASGKINWYFNPKGRNGQQKFIQ